MRLHPFQQLAAALLALSLAAPAGAQTLRIGIGADPNVLDPAQSTAYVERIVFTALCDRLVDVGPDLSFRPELATAWAWSEEGRTLTLTLRPDGRFHDGTAVDAAAVKVNLDRYRTARESRRRAELAAVDAVEAPDPRTVVIRLKEPFAPLLSVLSDRSGMILSPAALARLGERIREEPVCSGPFRLVRRVAQDRIEMERFPEHWNAANIHVQRLVMRPIPDSTVRMLNLRSGQLDIIERLAPSDVAEARRDPKVAVTEATSIAYQLFYMRMQGGALSDPRLREALELSLDRDIINQVALEGLFVPNNQPEAPGTPYHFPDLAPPARDLARAKALLREAGQPAPAFTLLVPNSPVESQVAQIIQAMAGEAGFQVKLEVLESSALVARSERGQDYDAAFGIWSGRPDPDGNIAPWLATDGFLNRMGYSVPAVDAAFLAARRSTDTATRQEAYRAAARRWMADRPVLVLYSYRWFWGMRAGITGFQPSPDGLIRFAGLRLPQ
ncbi:ABC transporter substrate-binding protein [Roseomonas sp. OT10]|uniref:ABC transporter substrate-binding protein n=1 Tax=Roseomonas cutis TaxID=2897332 RepID=UPI001E461463|nr:ABC transporter substrate-binding protein [Roseomonas sp. OT10]UFN49405.1 ABC transporter substrate-binding protein [Roseomonas sp. OT10]